MTRMTSKWLLQPLTKIICVFFVFFKDMFVATFETNEIDVGSGRIRIPVELGSQLKLIPYQQIAVVVNSGDDKDRITLLGSACPSLPANNNNKFLNNQYNYNKNVMTIDPLIIITNCKNFDTLRHNSNFVRCHEYKIDVIKYDQNVINAIKVKVLVEDLQINKHVVRLRLQQVIITKQCAFNFYQGKICFLEVVDGQESTCDQQGQQLYRVTGKTELSIFYHGQEKEFAEDSLFSSSSVSGFKLEKEDDLKQENLLKKKKNKRQKQKSKNK
eukprot:TRINITY_DN6334_c0_g1_i9.p1 TRINITY_DN6334_c0_g1~~TRINITY_DN6334_c0_g1_i9.p1  ORF type:complete len:280 (-),score=24.67 TRINITY_DN6334_c0_g1_i9:394-1206(-)